MFTKESLETLRQRIDLVEVLSPHIDLKRAGAAYKALCPFHDEKTPSFTVQKGDTHYHCFGCGAHGDAIQFLMTHLKLNFLDAVENLAQRFHVPLERIEVTENKGPKKSDLKSTLEHACRFYHFMLLHTPTGHEALQYLYSRGIGLDFIQQFQVGFAPPIPGLLRKVMHQKELTDEWLETVGLITHGTRGDWRDFFSDRITFPIRDSTGAVIGFSARKFKEETFGGKYVNTPETPLFKKSRTLFGLNYCRRRIAKERKVIVVEGQIDALKLIQAGFNITVAGQGTAFGEGHIKELLTLGVNVVYLALDSDKAGQEATFKIGHLFQKEGVEVFVIELIDGKDPDAFLREKGAEAFLALMENSQDYLHFLIKYYAKTHDKNSPAGKNELIKTLVKQIREWNEPVMVKESLKKIAHLMQVSEEDIGAEVANIPNIYIKRSANIGLQTIDPDRILEGDLLRWLLKGAGQHPHFLKLAREHVQTEDLRVEVCQKIYHALLEQQQESKSNLLDLAIQIDHPESGEFLNELLQKKINMDRAQEHFIETLQKILDRNWMQKREQVRMKIQSGQSNDAELDALIKEFNALNKNPPRVGAS